MRCVNLQGTSLPGSLFTFDYKNSLKTELGISVE